MEIKLNTIEEAIEEIKAGRVVIVVDDEDRENEGDLIMAAEFASAEKVCSVTTGPTHLTSPNSLDLW